MSVRKKPSKPKTTKRVAAAKPTPVVAVAPPAPAAAVRPPRVAARITRTERWRRTGSRFGDLSGSQLTSVLYQLDRGDPWDWCDLVEFWLSTDPDLASLYGTRIDRVLDRDWEVTPNEFGDQRLAELAAEFALEAIAKIENWDHALRGIAHAVAPGFSANELIWDYDRAQRVHFVRRIEHRHGHRFRYGPGWKLRFYDRGQVQSADGYGEVLNPDQWIVHQHQEQAGYPTVGGVMRASAKHNMLAGWVEKFRIAHVEKFASPVPSLQVSPDTPEETRRQMLDDLQDMSSDHAYVTELPNQLVLIASPAGASTGAHKETLDDYYKQRARLWLGSSDVADPGEHGSQGAVGERIDATSDPKTVSDCKGIATTLHYSLLTALIKFNAHRIGAPAALIPIPKLKAWKTEEELSAQRAEKQKQQMVGGATLPNGMPVPRIPEIQLSRDHGPKAAASGEPRRAKLLIGSAPSPSRMRTTSLGTRIDRLLLGG